MNYANKIVQKWQKSAIFADKSLYILHADAFPCAVVEEQMPAPSPMVILRNGQFYEFLRIIFYEFLRIVFLKKRLYLCGRYLWPHDGLWTKDKRDSVISARVRDSSKFFNRVETYAKGSKSDGYIKHDISVLYREW